MEISQKLAEEIITIVGFHIVAVLLLSGIAFYIKIKSRKGPLINAYLFVVAAFLIWMISKIFKTLSPTIELRWFFIVTQYVGINMLGIALFAFAYAYTKDRDLPRKLWILLGIPPVISLIIMATNPWHHLFYSYFDFYKDRFGPIFYPTQAVQYIYWISGAVLLARNFTKQPAFKGRRGWANFFTTITLIPIIANLYYVLFKLDVFEWIFPFRVFDITPIFGTIALILFTLPAMRYRFFDISPYSHKILFEQLDQGFAIVVDNQVQLTNPYASNHFTHQEILRFKELCQASSEGIVPSLRHLGCEYHIKAIQLNEHHKSILLMSDVTERRNRIEVVHSQSASLLEAQVHLKQMEAQINEIGSARAKSQVAQSVHDILGHSLTLAIGTAELASLNTTREGLRAKLHQIQEILHRGLAELNSSITDSNAKWQDTTLLKVLSRLDDESLKVVVEVQGLPIELPNQSSEALYRLCQEAMTNSRKHGQANRMHVILRFQMDAVTLFAIDNGSGCTSINENMGLSGIRNRIVDLGGSVSFYSDGEQGFTIKALLPI